MENIFSEKETEELIALHEGGNTHDFALRIYQKAVENNPGQEFSSDFFETNIAPQLDELMDNPVFSIIPTEQLIGVLYMSIETSIGMQEDVEEEEEEGA